MNKSQVQSKMNMLCLPPMLSNWTPEGHWSPWVIKPHLPKVTQLWLLSLSFVWMESYRTYSFLSHIIYGKCIPVSWAAKSFFLTDVDYSMYVPNFIHPTVDGHLECFQFWIWAFLPMPFGMHLRHFCWAYPKKWGSWVCSMCAVAILVPA